MPYKVDSSITTQQHPYDKRDQPPDGSALSILSDDDSPKEYISTSQYVIAWYARSYPGLYPSQIRELKGDWPSHALTAKPSRLPQYLIPTVYDSSLVGNLFGAMGISRDENPRLVTLDHMLLVLGTQRSNTAAADVSMKLREIAINVLRRFQEIVHPSDVEYFSLRLCMYQITQLAIRHSGSDSFLRLKYYYLFQNDEEAVLALTPFTESTVLYTYTIQFKDLLSGSHTDLGFPPLFEGDKHHTTLSMR